jgi:glycosyltransferase involved in cell wall biosynthesis
MKEKKVLIITDYFPPRFAPRMGYLSKYLGEHGWKGIAISPVYESDSNRSFFDFLSGYIPCERIYISKQRAKKKFFHKAISFFFPDMRSPLGLNNEMMYHINELMAKEKIDIILCSTYTLFPLNIAYKTAKQYEIPWIADLRDIEEQYLVKESLLMEMHKKIGILRRNHLLKSANAIIAVSKKHIEILNNYGLQASLIYNGFDPDMFIPSKYHELDKFRIVYTGALADTRVSRDVSPLFSAIQKLYNNGDINANDCRIQFYSDAESHKIVNELKNKFCISDFIDCFDYVPATEIPKILNESSILLLLIKGNTGIMTTKLFEYLGSGRPILYIWSDEGAIEDIINKSNTGIAAKTEEDIQLFIKSKYDEWVRTKYTNLDIDINFISKFSRKYNAKQFIEIFNTVLKNKLENK